MRPFKADNNINHKFSLEKIKETYYNLRSKLCKIINTIEINTSHCHQTPSPQEPKQLLVVNYFNPSIPHELRSYRKGIENLNRKLDSINKYEKVIMKEEDIKCKENQLNNLECENKALKLIYNNQTKGLLQYQNNTQSNEDLLFNIETIKLKEEIKLKNREYTQTSREIKEQLSQINIIEKKCNIIEENISYQIKHNKQNHNSNSNNKNYKTCNSNINIHSKIRLKPQLNKPELNIDDMKRIIERNQLQLSSEKSKDSLTLKNQKDKINQITQEINILSNRINQHDRINRLKEKEIKKKLYLIQQLNNIKIRSLINNGNDKLKSRNDSLSERQKENSVPKATMISKQKFQKVFEINQLICGNQSIVYKNNKQTIHHNSIFMDIESLSKNKVA